MGEKWKFITGYNNDYQVSNLGRVMSLKRDKPIFLKPREARGYLYVKTVR